MRHTESFFCILSGLGGFRLGSYPAAPRVAPLFYKQAIERIVFTNSRNYYCIKNREYLKTPNRPASQ